MQGDKFYLSSTLSQKVTGGYPPPKQGRGKHRVHETCDTNEVKEFPGLNPNTRPWIERISEC